MIEWPSDMRAIEIVVEDMLRLAQCNDQAVRTEFSGVQVIVSPKDSVEHVVRKYQNYQNSGALRKG